MLKVFQYEQYPVTFDQVDEQVMINATQMGQSFGKKPKDFLRTDQTKAFINELGQGADLPFENIVKTEIGGSKPGTWMHELLALKFAAWLSPAFELWCMRKLRELMTTGQAAIGTTDNVDFAAYLRETAQKVEDLESRLRTLQEKIPPEGEYFTVMGMATVLGMKITMAQASGIAKKVSRICQQRGWSIERVYDPRFGYKGSYPREALEMVMNGMEPVYDYHSERLTEELSAWIAPAQPTDPGARRMTSTEIMQEIKRRAGRDFPTLTNVWVGRKMKQLGHIQYRENRKGRSNPGRFYYVHIID